MTVKNEKAAPWPTKELRAIGDKTTIDYKPGRQIMLANQFISDE